MDPRAQRTVAAIRATVLELAARGPIENVPVTDVARSAGITRGSFYNHATSPVDVLVEVLGEELDRAGEVFRAETLGQQMSRRAAFERNIERVWAHIDAHRAIYRAGLGDSLSPALRRVLTEHLTVQMSAFLADRPGIVGAANDEQRAVLRVLYAAHAANGAVGIVEAWLGLDGEPDHELLLRASLNAAPEWWLDGPE